MKTALDCDRRDFLRVGGAVGAGLVLGTPPLWAQETEKREPPPRPKTNIDEAMAAPRVASSIPGPFPGRVVETHDPGALVDDKPVASVVKGMVDRSIATLTGKDMKGSFRLLFTKDDVIGIKVNPVGAGLISTRLEVVDALVEWLTENGVPRGNIILWDRFEFMLAEAGFTPERYPGLGIEGLQTMAATREAEESETDTSWVASDGGHISASRFDDKAFYWADVEGPEEKPYLRQHVFRGKHSYFGRLLTQRLTKIINVPVFKNTGNGISMATKNLGYGAICNTGRLHRPLFFDVCTEVLAFPAVRDKLVLNITDGLRAQYDGGPMPNAAFTYTYNTIFAATDPFALDLVCHNILVEKRKSMKVEVSEHPRYTDYLRYGERLGLGIADPARIQHARA
jgi:hypothetical protein